MIAKLVLHVALSLSISALCFAQRPASLPATSDPEIAKSWNIISASFGENLVDTQATIRLQNISGVTQPETHFWADYFDAQNRICFTLVFASTAIGPTHALELRSVASSLAPLSGPVRVHLRTVPSNITRFTADTPFRPPATVSEIGMQFDLPRSLESQQPIDDLLLATLHIDKPGKPKSVELLLSRNPEITTILTGLLQNFTVQPSTTPTPEPDELLVLIRIATGSGLVSRTDPATLLPRTTPWIMEYLRAHPDSPPLTVLLYAADNLFATNQPRQTSADQSVITYQQISVGSSWSANVADPKWDSDARAFVRTFTSPVE